LIEIPGANRVTVRWTTEPKVNDEAARQRWLMEAGEERVQLWRQVLNALELAGQRLVGGALAWALRERQLRVEADRLPVGDKHRSRLLTEARKAKLNRERNNPFPHEDEHARAVFLNTLQVCAPQLPFEAAAALAWWLGLLPRSVDPFNRECQRALRRLADRHWSASFSEHGSPSAVPG
jgi:hypothetical protein